MGLGFLGRGMGIKGVCQRTFLAGVHVVGGAVGGALVGGCLGLAGFVLGMNIVRPIAVVLAVALALWYAIARHPWRLGISRQVPRKWAHTMMPVCRYFLWGVLLGTGVATIIPYSVSLIFLITQLTVGVRLAGIAGAIYGAVRTATPLVLLIRTRYQAHPEDLHLLLPRLYHWAKLLNILAIGIGGCALTLSCWR